MKLDARRIEGFLDAPGACRVVLLHGEDSGLIRERGSRLVRAVAGSLDDPFRVVELEKERISLIADECASQSLSGGRRVVRVRDAGEGAAAQVQAVLAGKGDALLVLEAPGLTSRSKLRASLERVADAVTIACYPLDARALEPVISEALAGFGVSIEADARSWLAGQLGADQGVTRREIEKLALYVGEGGRVDLDAARQCVGDLSGLSLEDAVFAATAGEVAAADRALELAMAEGGTAVGVLRQTLLHLQRLQRARSTMAEGVSALEATKQARPPVFFKREASFARALGLWSDDALQAACVRVWEAERGSKRTGSPAEVLCRSVVLGLAQRAAVARRR